MSKIKRSLAMLLAFFMVAVSIAGVTPVYAQEAETSGYQIKSTYDEEQNNMWQIAEKGAYGVLYEFKCGTRGASLPDAVTDQLPLDEKTYAMGASVSAILPEEKEIIGPKNNASNAPMGVWKFTGYDADSKVVSDDTLESGKDSSDSKLYVIFTGTWTFTVNQYDVSYEFVASDSSKQLPKGVTDQKPAAETDKVTHGKTAKPSKSSFKEVKDDDGKWVFKGWDPQEVQNVTADVTFTGTWEYVPNTYKVTYVFETEENKDLPASVTSQLPPEETHVKGDKVSMPVLDEEEISAEDGVWTFDGWDYDEVEVGTEDIIVTGIWSFAPYQYIVSYEFKSASDKGLPKEITALLPAPEQKKHGEKVTPPEPDETRIEAEEQKGIWLFKGWSPKEVDSIKANQKFVGTWKFYEYQEVIAKNLTVYEGGLGSNNSTTTGDALPEPTWAAQMDGHTVTVDGNEWDVSKKGLPFAWNYVDKDGKKVENSATVGVYALHVYPLAELKGKDVIIDDKYVLWLSEDGVQAGTVNVRDVTDNENADTLSTDTFKNVYNHESPQDIQASSFRSMTGQAALSEGSALDGVFDAVTGTHTDACDPEEPHAHVKEGTTFLKNGAPDMPVGENAKIGLLWDNLLENVLGQPARVEKLHEKSLDAIDKDTFDLDGTLHKDFKYIDLVDMTDGNIWVGTRQNDVTVYYPYPEGVDKEDTITVTWYEGLTRDYTIDMTDSDLDDEIDKTKAHTVNNLRKTETGILFDVPSKQFGPIEVMWQKSYAPAYEFISGTEGKELPQSIKDSAPKADQEYTEGVAITAPEVTSKEVKTEDGVWTFQKWDADSKVSAEGVKFTGIWTYEKNTSMPDDVPDKGNTNSSQPSVPGKTQGTDSPTTGDNTNLTLWSSILLVSVLLLVVLLEIRRKKKK